MPADPIPGTDPPGQPSAELAQLWQAWWRMFGFRAPLSGDVAQDLANASLLRDQAQFGFLNINATQSGDPALEKRIITQVASYGRQLGRLVDAVSVLSRHQDRTSLTDEDQRALNQLLELADQISAAKAQAAAQRIDHIVAEVRALRSDPETNHDALQRLREALSGD
jgi:hypothetical protein